MLGEGDFNFHLMWQAGINSTFHDTVVLGCNETNGPGLQFCCNKGFVTDNAMKKNLTVYLPPLLHVTTTQSRLMARRCLFTPPLSLPPMASLIGTQELFNGFLLSLRFRSDFIH